MLTQYSPTNRPAINTHIILRPYKKITNDIVVSDTSNTFYSKKGTVVSLIEYIKNTVPDKLHPLRKLTYLIPIKLTDGYYLVSPLSLVNNSKSKANKKKTKTIKQKIFNKIDARINELKMQALH